MTDWSYQQHQQKQLSEVAPETIRERARACQASAHYRYDGKQWAIGPYQGCGILAMLDDDVRNAQLRTKLMEVQQAILSALDEGAWYALPVASYHQTVANMLSNERFRQHITDRGLRPALPGMVKDTFDHLPLATFPEPVRIRVAGIGLFGTALGALGVFDSQADYERMTAFRAGFYGAAQMAALDVRMTRPFVAHITLGYFGTRPQGLQIQLLTDVMNRLNADFQQNEFCFLINQAGLRYYENLSDFRTEPDFPTIKI